MRLPELLVELGKLAGFVLLERKGVLSGWILRDDGFSKFEEWNSRSSSCKSVWPKSPCGRSQPERARHRVLLTSASTSTTTS